MFADLCDGVKKKVVCESGALTITPLADDDWPPPHWTVVAQLDATGRAMVDFNVTGKDKYPPVPLQLMLCAATSKRGQRKKVLAFSDLSGELAPGDVPLNHWVELLDA